MQPVMEFVIILTQVKIKANSAQLKLKLPLGLSLTIKILFKNTTISKKYELFLKLRTESFS